MALVAALILWTAAGPASAKDPDSRSSWVYEFTTGLFVCVVWQEAEKPNFGPRATAMWCMPKPLMPEVPITPDPPDKIEVRGTQAPAFPVDVTNRTP